MTRSLWLAGSLMTALLAILPPIGDLLEGSLIGHMLIQIPLLTLAGALSVRAFPDTWRQSYGRADPLSVMFLLVALFTLAFWLLPRYLDLAVSEARIGWLKYMSLFFMAGVPLGLAGPRLPSLVLGFLWANAIVMLFVMAWLYSVSPVRLCNNYLITEQKLLANTLFVIGAVALLGFVINMLTGGLSRKDEVYR